MKPEKFGDHRHHLFFGYYDVSPLNHDDSILLASRVPLGKRSSQPINRMEIGYYDRSQGGDRFIAISHTQTWCWQQGCRLQWYPLDGLGRDRTVIYNTVVNGRYGCRIRDIDTRKMIREYQWPVYAVSPDGRYGFFLNFSRLGRLRPGYGYSVLPDETAGRNMPDRDGIWRLDMHTGKAERLFSIRDITRFEPLESMAGAEHYFNHICVNPDSSRFFFFHVWLHHGKRHTRLITCNMDGSDRFALVNEGHISHYTWKSSHEILCFSSHARTGMHYHLYRDRCDTPEVFAPGLLTEDGHPSFSPDRRFFLTDTYPDRYGDRRLLLYNVQKREVIQLARFFSPFRFTGEFRCDLHPRWSPSGQLIVIDSAHEGHRAMYVIKRPNEQGGS